MADDDGAIPPDVWTLIAEFTRSKRSISRLGQVCHAARDGVTKTTRPWRVLEKKYRIQQSPEPTRARENVIRYVKDQEALKHDLAHITFSRERVLSREGTRLRLKDLEESLYDVAMKGRHFYDVYMKALTVPATGFFNGFHLPPDFGRGVSQQMTMTSMCAGYAAVCKSMNILVLVRADEDDDTSRSLRDTNTVFECIEDLLGYWNGSPGEGLPMPDWVVSTRRFHGEGEDDTGQLLRLRNSSTIFVCSMADPPPLRQTFDGIVVCAKYLGVPPEWLCVPGYPLPKYRVHFR